MKSDSQTVVAVFHIPEKRFFEIADPKTRQIGLIKTEKDHNIIYLEVVDALNKSFNTVSVEEFPFTNLREKTLYVRSFFAEKSPYGCGGFMGDYVPSIEMLPKKMPECNPKKIDAFLMKEIPGYKSILNAKKSMH